MRRHFALLSTAAIIATTLGATGATAAFSADQTTDSSTELLAKGTCSKTTGNKCHGKRNKLNLTTEQLEKIKSLKTAMKESNSPKWQQMKTLRKEFKDQLTSGEVNKSSLLAIQNKINSLRAELANERVGYMVEVQALLTDEQREQMRRRHLERSIEGGHKGKRWHGKRSGSKGGARSAQPADSSAQGQNS